MHYTRANDSRVVFVLVPPDASLSFRLCRKIAFSRQNPKVVCWKINDLRVQTFLFSVICDRAYETALRLQEAVVVQFDQIGTVAARFGTQNPGVAPANIYPTRDGKWIALSGAGDQPFVRLCEAIEAPEAPHDPRFATMAARLQHRQAIDDVVRAWVARHDLADVEARFFAVGVAGTAIQSVDDILADEHVQARQAFLTLRSQTGHDFLAPAPVPKFARTPARQPLGAPRLGEHTSAVQTSLETMTPQPRLKGPAEAGDPSGGG